MTTKELECFLSVYTTHSIKKSAERLYISSQALSKTIKKIETEVGTPLFIRTGQGLIPTHSAENLAEHAHVIINEFENIASSFSLAQSHNSTVLTVPATYGVLDYIGYGFVRAFYIRHPNIRLNLVELPEVQIGDLLSSGAAELAFMPAPVDYSVFDARFCFAWKHCTIINTNHPLASHKTISYSDLDGIPLALRGRSYSVYPSNISRFLKEGVNPNILLETTSETLINQFADANTGIGISLTFLAERMHSSSTVIREFDDPNCQKEVYLVKRKGAAASSDASCLISFMDEWLTTHG